MIEIFEPGSPEYSSQQARQELSAARAATLLKAKSAHFELAATHLEAARRGAMVGKLPEELFAHLLLGIDGDIG